MATTRAILAAYLDSDIEVEVCSPDGFRAKLIGITPPDPFQNPVHVRDLSDGMRCDSCWLYEDVLPVLRPFSQLYTPLEDGTILAVELAKHYFFGEIVEAEVRHGQFPASNGARLSPYRSVDEIGGAPTHLESVTVKGWLKNGLRNEKISVCIMQDGVLSNNWHHFNIADWLRANHYALPVNGRPLVEGEDFIAKDPTPPATPTTDKEGSHAL